MTKHNKTYLSEKWINTAMYRLLNCNIQVASISQVQTFRLARQTCSSFLMWEGTDLTCVQMLLNCFAIELSLVNMCSGNSHKPPRANVKLSSFLLQIHTELQAYIHTRKSLLNLQKGVAFIGIAFRVLYWSFGNTSTDKK